MLCTTFMSKRLTRVFHIMTAKADIDAAIIVLAPDRPATPMRSQVCTELALNERNDTKSIIVPITLYTPLLPCTHLPDYTAAPCMSPHRAHLHLSRSRLSGSARALTTSPSHPHNSTCVLQAPTPDQLHSQERLCRELVQ